MNPADVRVSSFGLDVPAPVLRELDAVLAPEERDAAPRVRVARAVTRTLLGKELTIEPAALVISRRCARCGHGSHGRPTVVDADISFSLSHSSAFAVVAIGRGDVRVGVDVEAVEPRVRLDALAARVLNDDEHAAWSAIRDEGERLRTFLRAWTAREAYLKALGIGIVTRLRDVPTHVEGWSTGEIDVGDAWIAALAVDRSEFEVTHRAMAPLATSSGGTAG
ncbi:MAG: 4-phosphopantetheinyl transferase [Actinomycetota bacterium]|nr:4-phosphopantetheinyl transferase [Actinomycetota bacterium]